MGVASDNARPRSTVAVAGIRERQAAALIAAVDVALAYADPSTALVPIVFADFDPPIVVYGDLHDSLIRLEQPLS